MGAPVGASKSKDTHGKDRGKNGAREQALSPPLRSPYALTRRIKSAQRSRTGSVLSAVSGWQGDDYPRGAHVAVALQQIGILGAAE